MPFDLDFQLAEVLPNGFVTGRHISDIDLPLGTTFTALGVRQFPVWVPGAEIPSVECKVVMPISVHLESIEAYQHYLDFLNPSMTAKLGLKGGKLSEIGTLVAAAGKGMYYSLLA